MHSFELGYDPAKVPLRESMVKVLRRHVNSSSIGYVAHSTDKLTRGQIEGLYRGRKVTKGTKKALERWYMLDRINFRLTSKSGFSAKTPMPKRAVKELKKWIEAAPDGIQRHQRMLDVSYRLGINI